MIRLGMALIALASTVAINPYVDAVLKTDNLNLITLKPEIISSVLTCCHLTPQKRTH